MNKRLVIQDIEMDLWHGTEEDTVERIAQTKFDRRFAGKRRGNYQIRAQFIS